MTRPPPEEHLSTSMVHLRHFSEFHDKVGQIHREQIAGNVERYCREHGVPRAEARWICSSHSLAPLLDGTAVLTIVGLVRIWVEGGTLSDEVLTADLYTVSGERVTHVVSMASADASP